MGAHAGIPRKAPRNPLDIPIFANFQYFEKLFGKAHGKGANGVGYQKLICDPPGIATTIWPDHNQGYNYAIDFFVLKPLVYRFFKSIGFDTLVTVFNVKKHSKGCNCSKKCSVSFDYIGRYEHLLDLFNWDLRVLLLTWFIKPVLSSSFLKTCPNSWERKTLDILRRPCSWANIA